MSTATTKRPTEITLVPGREYMNEGRTSGIAFSFLQRTAPRQFKAVHCLSACKDYLNDIVYTERTKRALRDVYGLSTKYLGLFEKARYAYLVMASLYDRYDQGLPPKGIPDQIKAMKENRGNIQLGINHFEDMLKFPHTRLVECEGNATLCVVPLKWTESSWAISAWALLVRNLLRCPKDNPEKYLLSRDRSLEDESLRTAMERLKTFAKEGGFPQQDWKPFARYLCIHAYGIRNYMPEHALSPSKTPTTP